MELSTFLSLLLVNLYGMSLYDTGRKVVDFDFVRHAPLTAAAKFEVLFLYMSLHCIAT